MSGNLFLINTQQKNKNVYLPTCVLSNTQSERIFNENKYLDIFI